MLKNYLHVALRSFLGNKLFSFINVFGLAVGLASAMLIALYVGDELNYDNFHPDAARLYRISRDIYPLAVMGAALLLFSLLTGSVPALVLSRFKPGQLIRSRVYFDSDKSAVIRGLIVFQFALAIMMLASSVAVSLQMRYVAEKDLGFDEENLVVVGLPGSVADSRQLAERFLAEAVGIPSITGITYASAPPGAGVRRLGYNDDNEIFRQFDAYDVGPDFLPVMGMELIEGRPFRTDAFDSTQALIVNEAFLREYGWEQGVGQRLPGRDFPDHEIIGVVRDANFSSLRDAVRPTVFALSLERLNEGITDRLSFSSPSADLLIRTDGSAPSAVLPELEAVWKRIGIESGFDYYVLETALEALYSQQANFQEIVLSSTGLAVFLAAIGLFAMAVLVTTRRTREIGVRKVMGGSVWSIVLLLTNDFSKLVLISNVIAWPVAYIAMERWLQNFAYRIDLTPLVFIGSGLIALCIAWVTVGGTAAKAASQKPVLALRYE